MRRIERTGGAPTLEQVAAAAGLSRATVSRVINGSPRVTAGAVAAVNAAVDELGYVPNRAARVLASRRTQSIALVIPENTARFFSDPYFASAVQGAAIGTARTDYTLTMLITSESDPDKTRRYLRGGNVDGALVISHHSDDRSYVHLGDELPVVFGGRPVGEGAERACYVDVDNEEVARMAVRHLASRGRRRIAAIAGPQTMAAGLDRHRGWRLAVQEEGLEHGPEAVGDFTPEGGAEAMRALLASGEPFDGLFAASAQMAHGALGVLRDRGIDVPGAIGAVTVDDDYFARNAVPPLTTVRQPTVALGGRMVDVLVARIEGSEVPRVTIMPIELVERGSG